MVITLLGLTMSKFWWKIIHYNVLWEVELGGSSRNMKGDIFKHKGREMLLCIVGNEIIYNLVGSTNCEHFCCFISSGLFSVYIHNWNHTVYCFVSCPFSQNISWGFAHVINSLQKHVIELIQNTPLNKWLLDVAFVLAIVNTTAVNTFTWNLCHR